MIIDRKVLKHNYIVKAEYLVSEEELCSCQSTEQQKRILIWRIPVVLVIFCGVHVMINDRKVLKHNYIVNAEYLVSEEELCCCQSTASSMI